MPWNELQPIWVSQTADSRNTSNARHIAIGMVKKHAIAYLHLITHKITRLVIADAIPIDRLIWKGSQIVNRHIAGLGFH
jgi:hypothetical protein